MPNNQNSSDRPRRFYKEAAVSHESGKWQVELDGRPVRTQEKNRLAVDCKPLADLMTQEWAGQGDTIDPLSMPITRFVNIAVDQAPGNRDALADEMAKYAETDLVCHLADHPAELRARQEAGWKPWREWAGRALDVVLIPVEGIMAARQPPASLKAARDHAMGLDDFRLTLLLWATTLYGSAVLALAVERGDLSAVDAFELSRIDEAWQAERWGEDEEAMQSVRRRRFDADAIGRALAALGG